MTRYQLENEVTEDKKDQEDLLFQEIAAHMYQFDAVNSSGAHHECTQSKMVWSVQSEARQLDEARPYEQLESPTLDYIGMCELQSPGIWSSWILLAEQK